MLHCRGDHVSLMDLVIGAETRCLEYLCKYLHFMLSDAPSLLGVAEERAQARLRFASHALGGTLRAARSGCIGNVAWLDAARVRLLVTGGDAGLLLPLACYFPPYHAVS